MVWPFSKKEEPKETSDVSEGKSSGSKTPRRTSAPRSEQPLLLEDTEPRFNNGPAKPDILKEAVNSISKDDFAFDSLVRIPCLREALLTGISSLFVFGSVIFIARKSPSKAANWGVGGFLLGSTVSWEQCRSKRRKEQAFAAQARDVVAKKEKPMMNYEKNEELAARNEKTREEIKSMWGGGRS